MQKRYDYEQVLSFTGTNGTMDSNILTLQKKIKELSTLLDETQESYHGVGTQSSIYNKYADLFTKIKRYRQLAHTIAFLTEQVWDNAKKDKDKDENGN